VPPRNIHFTGREELLQQLHDVLRQQPRSSLVPQPVHGLGGIGKSQLAIEFAYRNQLDYELVWWVQADDEPSIRRSLAALARRLGLAESEDLEVTVERVLDALRLGIPHANWLLIYDNAPEQTTVQRYLPNGAGHVLVTSRSRSWAGVPSAIEIDVFAPGESVALLRSRWGGLTAEQALFLAERLGQLPLALEQAAAMHEQTGMPLGAYLQALKTSPRELLDEGTPTGYIHPLATMVALVYNRMMALFPPAARLLELCACISPQPIAIPILVRGRSGQPALELRDDIWLRRAVRDAEAHGLLQLDPGRDEIRMNSLISAVLRDIMPADRRALTQQAAWAVLAAANPGTPDSPSTWPGHVEVAPHVVPSGMIFSSEPDARRAVLDQIRYHFVIGDYTTSRSLAQSALGTWRAALGPDDEMALVAVRHLANAERMLGNYKDARALNEDTLDRSTRALGSHHENTLATATNLAADLRIAGELADARDLDQANLSRYRAVLGERGTDTLRALSNLAVNYRMVGEHRMAKELDEENIALRTDVFGADHPRTLLSYTCLIWDLCELGEFRRGLALAREKMPICEQNLPDNHRDLLLARRILAILLRKVGHNDEARPGSEELYEACRHKFGHRHEHTLSAMVTLSNVLRVAGDLTTALKFGQDALTSYRDVFGKGHVFTLGCQVNVAILLRLLDRKTEASTLNDDALAKLVLSLGDDNPYALCAANTKVNDLAANSQFEEARALGEQTLARSRRVRGGNHPNTLACASNLATDLEKLGEVGQANQLRRETIDKLGTQLGLDHPETTSAGIYRRLECDVEIPAT
jgi:hypothetical protein